MGRMTGAAIPLDLKTEDGSVRKFLLTPLSDKDIDEIDEWLAKRIIENARASLNGSSKAERDETLALAMRMSLEVTLLSATGARMIATLAGMTRLAWQSVKKNHPDVTEDELRHLLLLEENLDELNRVWDKANSSGKDVETTSKNRQRARRRK